MDIEKSAEWYDQRQSGLGVKFVRAIRLTIGRLLNNPLMYRVRSRRFRVRWCLPARFPYRIVYRVDGEMVTIVAVLHSMRHDHEWRKRV